MTAQAVVKLPKQWSYWCKKARLYKSGRQQWLSIIGRNRVWRINRDGNFECSCPLEHFDRWANSRGAEMQGIPKTESEFLQKVRDLYEKSMHAT